MQINETIIYDPKTRSGGIFTDYININLKAKQEASGYPEECKTERDKEEYIRNYFSVEGILLESKNIINNPGLRKCSKDKLVNLWGYFGLDGNKTLFKIIYKLRELEDLLDDDQYLIHNIDFAAKS